MTSADQRATAAAASKCAWLGGLPPSLTERIVVLSPAEARPDVVRPAHQVSVPARGRRLRVAVVGAGLAGLTAARILEEQGHDVVVVEKARGAGGRSATRRHEAWRFDHGAQYFTARDPRFLQHVLAWQERGSIALWEGRIGVVEKGRVQAAGQQTRRFVGLPGMNAVCRDMAGELSDCRFQWWVQSVAFEQGAWKLREPGGNTLEAQVLVMTTPPEQVGPLLDSSALRGPVHQVLKQVTMRPCWALMAVFDEPLLEDWDAAFVNDGALAWVCGQRSKPGRPPASAWVLHATPEWSEAHLELAAGEAAERLLEAARALPGVGRLRAEYAAAHRWRYALAREPLDRQALWFEEQRLALAGDWCAGSRVEGAFLSGVAAAGRVLGCDLARAGGERS